MAGDVGADPVPSGSGLLAVPTADAADGCAASDSSPALPPPREGVKETGAGDEAAAVALLIRSRMAADEVPVLVRALMR
jgi:hypothetical protein